MKGIIIYRTRTGRTEKYAEEIGLYLTSQGIETKVISIRGFKADELKEMDFILLGCWTGGLMIAFQHPDKEWIEFSRKLPDLSEKRVGLFTTYKIAAGGVFKNMEKYLKAKVVLRLKSRNCLVSDSDKKYLLDFLR